MKLSEAMTIGARFAGDKDAFTQANLSPGWLMVANPEGGARFAIEHTVTGSVDAAALAKIAKEDVTISKSARKLKLDADGASYTLPLGSLGPEFVRPEPPTAGWRKIDAKVVGALRALTDLVDQSKMSPVLSAIRLSSEWSAAASTAGVSVVWAGVLDRGMTVPVRFLAGITGEAEFAVADKVVWYRSGDQYRWTRTLDAEWPERSVEQMIGVARNVAGAIAKVSTADLRALTKRALRARQVPADVFRLHLVGAGSGGTITIDRVEDDATGFQGTTKADYIVNGTAIVGVDVEQIERITALVTSEDVYIALGQSTEPIRIWGTDSVVECVANPRYL
jgi:hypothetical protein